MQAIVTRDREAGTTLLSLAEVPYPARRRARSHRAGARGKRDQHPLPPGTGDFGYVYAVDEVVACRRTRPRRRRGSELAVTDSHSPSRTYLSQRASICGGLT
jgi:hypothetical protein